MRSLLVYDLGTTNFKAALYTEDGTCHAVARRPTPFRSTDPGRRELDPDAVEQSLFNLGRELQDQAPPVYQHVAALSFSSQANTLTLLDAEHRPLTPLIAWNDPRRTSDDAWFDAFASMPDRYAQTGLPVASHQFAAARLRWLAETHRDAWRSARRFCLLSEFITHRLTGVFAAEPGLAGLTGLFDIQRRAWWRAAVKSVGLPEAWLPKVVDAGRIIAPLTTQARAGLGLRGEPLLVMGCLDQYAGALAAGNVRPGRVSETTGTVLAVVACHARFDPTLESRGIFQGPAANADHVYRMVFSEASANLLEAYRLREAADLTTEQLLAEAEQLDPETQLPELDLPASEASGQPVFDRPCASIAQGTLAILRGVADRLADHIRTLCNGVLPGEVVCLGGGARSAFWLDLKAQAVGVPMRALGDEEPTCRGAMLCARAGLLSL